MGESLGSGPCRPVCDHERVETDLAERYGAPAATSRRAVVGVAVLVAVVFGGWLAWTTLFHATPVVSSEIGGWEIVDDGTVDVTVTVSLDEDVDASCVVRAYAEDHTTVGEAAFEPVDGRNEVSLRTERRATSITLLGCTAPGQPRPR
jgi:hypothetical protein